MNDFRENGKIIRKAVVRLPMLWLPIMFSFLLAVAALLMAWKYEPLQACYRVLLIDSFLLPLFACLVYIFSVQLLADNGAEVFRAIPGTVKSIMSYCGIGLLLLLSVICLFQFTGLWLHALSYGLSLRLIGQNLLLSLLLYAFLPGITGIALGLSVSPDSPSQAYITILLFGILMSPFMPTILFNTMIGQKTRLDQWIAISVPSDMTLDHLYGIPTEWARFSLILFWLFLFLVIWLAEQKEKGKLMKIVFVVCMLGLLSSGIGFILRDKIYILDTVSNHGKTFADYYYYETPEGTGDEAEADFSIAAYDLDLFISDHICATAVVTLSKDSCDREKYCFTLQHGLECKSVKDENGRDLSFRQDRDFLDVFVGSGNNLRSLVFIYQGNMTYYANRQGIVLPGYAAFYPLPGHQLLWNSEKQSLSPASRAQTASYTITVDSPLQVYSNLAQTDDNCFKGTAESVILYAGRAHEKQIGEIKVVEPLCGDEVWTLGIDDIMNAWKNLSSLLNIPDNSLLRESLQHVFVLPEFPFTETKLAAYKDFTVVRFIDVWAKVLDANDLAAAVAEVEIASSSETEFLEKLFHNSLLKTPLKGWLPPYEDLMPLIELSQGKSLAEIGTRRLQNARESLEALYNYGYHQLGRESFLPAVYAYLTNTERTEHPADFLCRLAGGQ